MAFTEQTSGQASEQKRRYPERRNAHTWVKGQSGNRLGARLTVERRKSTEAKAEEIFRQILADFDNLTALEMTLARGAATNLALAATTTSVDVRSRLLSSAARTLDGLRKRVAERAEAAPTKGFDL